MTRFSTAVRTCLCLSLCTSLFFACDDGTGGGDDFGAEGVGDGDGDGDGDGEGGENGDGDGVSLGAPCQSDKDCRSADGLCHPDRSVCVECLTENDCGTNEACLSGLCSPYTTCTSTRDCPLDEVCDTSVERCVECIGDNDCVDGQVCVATRCATACTSDKDCRAEDKVCALAQGICQECVTAADCEDGEVCDPAGTCVPGNSGGTGGGENSSGGGENGSGGGSGGPCDPEVTVLLQRSGAMFEAPNLDDNWWSAVSDALDGSESDMLDKYASSMDITVTTFHQITAQASCEVLTSSNSPLAANGLASFLADEAAAHEAYVDEEMKVDAPVPDAVEAAAGSLTGSSDRYLLLVLSGNPDSCAQTDSYCVGEPAVEAVEDAYAAGVKTKVLYLGAPFAGMEGYPQGLANAGAGLGIEAWGLELSCGEDYDFYEESPGAAPLEQPMAVGEVFDALDTLLGDIAACN